jgi:chaperonin GroEL
MPKQIDAHLKARNKLLRGARLLAKTVAVTYGPKGRTVMLDRLAGLLATKDGVTVAREVVLPDPVESMGAETLKEACIKVNEQVGDGTTTVAIVAASLLEECHRLVAAGFDPMRIAEGVKSAAERGVQIVEDMALPIESQDHLEHVALVASNGDEEIAKALAEACLAVGNDGTISVQDGVSVGIDLEFKDGMEIDKGAVSPGFLRESGGVERLVEGPLIAVFGGALREAEDVQHVLEESSQWASNDLVIFSESVEGKALSTMLVNDAQDVVRSVAVNAPGFGPKREGYLRDIAALSGATFIDPSLFDFRKRFDPEWFGSLRKITIKQRSSVLEAYDEAQDTIRERIAELKREAGALSSDYDQDQHAERIAKLAGGLCVMRIGGPTEIALKERRGRVEDALGSVRGALEQGVVPGAGSAYLTVAECLPNEHDGSEGGLGWEAFAKALKAPLAAIASNAGHDGRAVAWRATTVRESHGEYPIDWCWIGWDARVEDFRDLREDPRVIDPAPVVKSVIKTAASVAATLLTSEISISEA